MLEYFFSDPLISFSEMLLKKMMDEGINPDTDNVCLYDISALRFKFNGIEAMTNKFMNDYFHYDCKGLKRNLRMLQQVSDYFIDELKQLSMKDAQNCSMKASTPRNHPEQSEGGDFYYQASDKTLPVLPSREPY